VKISTVWGGFKKKLVTFGVGNSKKVQVVKFFKTTYKSNILEIFI